MAKIGTVHVEVKPVLDEQALVDIGDRVRAVVEKAVMDGMTIAIPRFIDQTTARRSPDA